ncbi:MAG TPA: TolC family protein [Gemmatimonadales bacterium]|nr:TolC family protein [Gemmatimonadales bacterium]
MRYALAILGLALAPVLAAAQSPPARLSLADALVIARDNNPLYRQALHDRSPAAWGVRNAYASTFLPSVSSSFGTGYLGQGQQQFFSSSFSQSIATWSSSYNLGLNWTLSGSTLAQPGLRKAELAAADANIAGAESDLIADVTTQYLTVLQAVENAGVAQARLDHDKEFLVLAKARYDVGRATLIDVRQAEVARGQAEVALLRAQTSIDVEKLRLYEILGVNAPTELSQVQLTDSFPVTEPPWKLDELMTMAEQQNPSLKALRARENAANWGVRAATSSYGPQLSLSAGWSGFSQKVSDLNAAYAAGQAQADTNLALCNYQNSHWLNSGLGGLPCNALAFGAADSQAIRDANSRYPWHFTTQPFQLQLTLSLPLFTNFARPFQVSQAKAQRDDLTEAVRARGLAVRTQVSQAFLVLGTAYRAIGIQDTNRTAAREQLQLATDRYRVGSGTFFELLDAQLQQLNAELDYVSAVYAYHKAVAALEQAVGRRLR